MGALAGLEQREEVRRGIKALADAGRIVYGDPEKVELVDADAERGAFLSPILLVGDPERAEPHEVEAFGPVSTVLPYTSTRAARRLRSARPGQPRRLGGHRRPRVRPRGRARRGAVARPAARAQRHGREGVHRARLADAAARARRPRPRGRRRGAGRHARRAAPHAAHRRAGRPGHRSPRSPAAGWRARRAPPTDVHPFRKHLEELPIGDTVVAGPRAVTQEDVEHFAEFTGDTFYAHMDAEAAAKSPIFGERVAHGYLTLAFAAGLFVDPDPGPVLANYGLDRLRYLTPVRFGDEITVTLTCKQITPHGSQPYGDVRWDADVTRQDGESVARYDVLTLVARKDAR